MRATEFKERRKNTLRGFFTLELDNGMHIRDCTLHESNGKSWIGFPGVPWTDKDGKTQYKNVVIVPDRAVMDKVQASVCTQLRAHLDAKPSAAAPSKFQDAEETPF